MSTPQCETGCDGQTAEQGSGRAGGAAAQDDQASRACRADRGRSHSREELRYERERDIREMVLWLLKMVFDIFFQR
ncbi:MAG TPA: hypothetical protein VGX23_00345 [Actinocrinis sp.]|nr:hypothetical protein [Actinocrinis sp.]